MKNSLNKNYSLKVLVKILELLTFSIFLFLVCSPILPLVEFDVKYANAKTTINSKNIREVAKAVTTIKNTLPKNKSKSIGNRIIIPKIGVNMPIIESKDAKSGLAKGSWHDPQTSTPDKGGNTVLTGHRYKYLPPSNMTFYLLDKLEKGDIFSVVWNNKDYYYRVRGQKTVNPTEISILNNTKDPIITLYTCTPVFTSKYRLVVVADYIGI